MTEPRSIDGLPPGIRSRLHQTLGQWRHWQLDEELPARPAPMQLLGPGLSNFCVLVAAQRRFVVRIDGLDPGAIGLNRQAEWRALRAAAARGLAPAPRYFNPELGSLVCDYLAPDPMPESRPGAVAELLRAIHRLPAIHTRLDLRERLLRYEHRLAAAGVDPETTGGELRREALACLEEIEETDPPPVLCHNDLLQANRLLNGGRLRALDWEYCAMGSPWYDLAVVVIGDRLPPGATDELLRAYLGRAPTDAEWTMLRRHASVYRYLESLWHRAFCD